MQFELTDEQRADLGGLADVILPHAEGMPAATEVGVHGRLMDQVLNVRDDLAPAIFEAIDRSRALTPRDALVALREADYVTFSQLVLAVRGAYYMSPEVRQLLGYEGGKARPAPYEASAMELSEGILDPVLERGPIYREVPEGAVAG